MPNRMFRNQRRPRFVDVTPATGTGHLQKGHGVAFADLDNDGDEDVVLNVGGAVPGDRYDDALFRNPGGSGNNWLSGPARRRQEQSRRRRRDHHGPVEGRRAGPREVTTGGSFGASPFTQHIGLGKGEVESLTIRWPVTRTTQVFRAVPINQALEIHELAKAHQVIQRKAFRSDLPRFFDWALAKLAS